MEKIETLIVEDDSFWQEQTKQALPSELFECVLAENLADAIDNIKNNDFDLIILESAGIGQADSSVVDMSDIAMYVMTPEFGAASQLEKIDMLDFADYVAINKFDRHAQGIANQ